MNAQTVKDLQNFIHEVENLAAGSYHLIGEDAVKRLIESAEQIIKQLDKDETILK